MLPSGARKWDHASPVGSHSCTGPMNSMPSASITLISSPTINGGLPMSVLLPLWPVDSHDRMPACGCHGVGFYCASDRSFRTAATTSTMAALVACASLRSYTRDVCVAPSTTRCMLLDERVARSSCSSSHSGSCVPALTTASGLSPRLLRLRVWVTVWGVARSSSEVVLTCRVEGLSASICALLLRQFGGCGNELEQQAKHPDPCQQGRD